MRNEEQKNLDFENDPVTTLLGGLKRVDAPGDFDFRVKARIVAGRPVVRTVSWLSKPLRVAVPVALLLLVVGYFGFNAVYSPKDVALAPVATFQPDQIAPRNDAPQSENVESPPTGPDDRLAVKPPENINKNIVAEKPKDSGNEKMTIPKSRKALSGPRTSQPGGGTREETLGIVHTLSPLGISTTGSGSSVTIGSVKPGSIAERSGLKAGDVIEARGTTSLRVRRDGKSIVIELKP